VCFERCLPVRFQAIVEMEWDSVETLHDVTGRDRYYESARRVVEDIGVVAQPGVYRLALHSSAG
jgi:hypothetical protein